MLAESPVNLGYQVVKDWYSNGLPVVTLLVSLLEHCLSETNTPISSSIATLRCFNGGVGGVYSGKTENKRWFQASGTW